MKNKKINGIGTLGLSGMWAVSIWFHRFDVMGVVFLAFIFGAMAEYHE